MIGSIALALQAFESGYWLGVVGWNRRERARTRARLVWGRSPATHLPIIDHQLQQRVGLPTRLQRRLADTLVKSVRWSVRTRAFELLVLKGVRRYWPMHQLNPEVKLCR